MEKAENRQGQINIMVYGAEKFGIGLDSPVLDDRNYKLHFEPYQTNRRLCDFYGVITFQRLFEKFKLVDSYWDPWTEHSYDRNELDKREKEADILVKNGGFLVFLLHQPFRDHIYENMQTRNFRDTDLAKRFLNWDSLYREDLGQRYTGLKTIRDEFLRFFELYGAVWSAFSYFGALSWRNLAVRNGKPVSMIIDDRLFFIPCLLPDQGSERKEEFYRLLTDATVTCIKKLHVELPTWADQFVFPREQDIIEEGTQLYERLEALEKMRSELSRIKRVLVGDGDALVEDVVYALSAAFEYKVTSDENYREDIQILNEKGEPVIFGEVKGTTRGVKREFINQADSHRERAGYSSSFPTLLIINTHIKNSRTLEEKDQEVASEQIRHAVKLNVLVIRTLDLLNLVVLVQKNSITSGDLMKILQTEAGWLRVSGDMIKVHKE